LPRSQLVFTTVAAFQDPAQQAVIPLHGHGGHPTDLIPLAQAVGPWVELWVPRAPRPAYFGRDTVAHYWYVGERDGFPDPPSFGDCLFQVEQFTLDVVDQTHALGRPPILMGVGQGAVLALAAAKVIPDYLGGVVAVAGYVPRFPGLELPFSDLGQLPILMINGPHDQARRMVQGSAALLKEQGARIELHDNANTLEPSSAELCRLVRSWAQRNSDPDLA
jgi:phospholipase/carboxylesterase